LKAEWQITHLPSCVQNIQQRCFTVNDSLLLVCILYNANRLLVKGFDLSLGKLTNRWIVIVEETVTDELKR
jgi:hypothetical protein